VQVSARDNCVHATGVQAARDDAEVETTMSEAVHAGDLVHISDTAGTWVVEEIRSGIALLRDGEDRRISSRVSKLTVVRRGGGAA
jgi:hypothetical protein